MNPMYDHSVPFYPTIPNQNHQNSFFPNQMQHNGQYGRDPYAPPYQNGVYASPAPLTIPYPPNFGYNSNRSVFFPGPSPRSSLYNPHFYPGSINQPVPPPYPNNNHSFVNPGYYPNPNVGISCGCPHHNPGLTTSNNGPPNVRLINIRDYLSRAPDRHSTTQFNNSTTASQWPTSQNNTYQPTNAVVNNSSTGTWNYYPNSNQHQPSSNPNYPAAYNYSVTTAVGNTGRRIPFSDQYTFRLIPPELFEDLSDFSIDPLTTPSDLQRLDSTPDLLASDRESAMRDVLEPGRTNVPRFLSVSSSPAESMLDFCRNHTEVPWQSLESMLINQDKRDVNATDVGSNLIQPACCNVQEEPIPSISTLNQTAVQDLTRANEDLLNFDVLDAMSDKVTKDSTNIAGQPVVNINSAPVSTANTNIAQIGSETLVESNEPSMNQDPKPSGQNIAVDKASEQDQVLNDDSNAQAEKNPQHLETAIESTSGDQPASGSECITSMASAKDPNPSADVQNIVVDKATDQVLNDSNVQAEKNPQHLETARESTSGDPPALGSECITTMTSAKDPNPNADVQNIVVDKATDQVLNDSNAQAEKNPQYLETALESTSGDQPASGSECITTKASAPLEVDNTTTNSTSDNPANSRSSPMNTTPNAKQTNPCPDHNMRDDNASSTIMLNTEDLSNPIENPNSNAQPQQKLDSITAIPNYDRFLERFGPGKMDLQTQISINFRYLLIRYLDRLDNITFTSDPRTTYANIDDELVNSFVANLNAENRRILQQNLNNIVTEKEPNVTSDETQSVGNSGKNETEHDASTGREPEPGNVAWNAWDDQKQTSVDVEKCPICEQQQLIKNQSDDDVDVINTDLDTIEVTVGESENNAVEEEHVQEEEDAPLDLAKVKTVNESETANNGGYFELSQFLPTGNVYLEYFETPTAEDNTTVYASYDNMNDDDSDVDVLVEVPLNLTCKNRATGDEFQQEDAAYQSADVPMLSPVKMDTDGTANEENKELQYNFVQEAMSNCFKTKCSPDTSEPPKKKVKANRKDKQILRSLLTRDKPNN